MSTKRKSLKVKSKLVHFNKDGDSFGLNPLGYVVKLRNMFKGIRSREAPIYLCIDASSDSGIYSFLDSIIAKAF
jgi:hypothetical protein